MLVCLCLVLVCVVGLGLVTLFVDLLFWVRVWVCCVDDVDYFVFCLFADCVLI